MFCLLSCAFLFVGDKAATNCFEDDIITLIKGEDRIKFAHDVALNFAREKGNHDEKSHIKYLSNNMYMIH